MKKSILLILLMTLLSAPIYADEATEDCLDMAKNFYAAGDFGQAKEYLKLILAKNPTHYGANCLLIKMLPPGGFLNETTLDSKIIIRPACTNSGVKTSDKYNEQGRDYYKKSDYEKAKEAKPDNRQLWGQYLLNIYWKLDKEKYNALEKELGY